MLQTPWMNTILIVLLAVNAAVVFGYRVYRLAHGGPITDAIGGAVLAALLGAIAIGVALEIGWAEWAAAGYGALFAIAVMPLWTLAVLIPMRPGPVDYAFTVVYWASLIAIVVAAAAS